MRIQKARKPHRCDLCLGAIPKGARYWRDFARNQHGDVVRDNKQHTNCEDCRPPCSARLVRRHIEGGAH